MEIPPQSNLGSIGPSSASRLMPWSPGDLIQARVLGTSARGLTLLQVGGITISADRDLGAKPGEVLRLVVQKAPPTTAPAEGAPLRLAVQRLENVQLTQRLAGPNASTAPAALPERSGRPFLSAELFRIGVMNGRINGAPATMTEWSAAPLPGAAVLINNKRIHNYRKRFLRRIANTTAQTRIEASQEAQPRSVNSGTAAPLQRAAENRASESPFEYSADFGIESSLRRKAGVRMKINPEARFRGATPSEGALSASLLLNFDNTGVIEVNLFMVEDQLRVDFKTATPQMCQKLAAERRAVYAALAALGKKVSLQLRCDHQLMNRALCAEGPQGQLREIDFRL